MEINKKTADLKGMPVPVEVIVDTAAKTFTIEVGTPASLTLIKKGSRHRERVNPLTDKVADLKIEQIVDRQDERRFFARRYYEIEKLKR